MSQNARNMRGHKFLAKAGRKHLQGCVLRKPVGSPRNTQNLWNKGCPFLCKTLRFSIHPRQTVSNLLALLEHSPGIDKDKNGWQLRRYHGKLMPCTLSPCNLLGWSAIRPKLSASITMVFLSTCIQPHLIREVIQAYYRVIKSMMWLNFNCGSSIYFFCFDIRQYNDNNFEATETNSNQNLDLNIYMYVCSFWAKTFNLQIDCHLISPV